MGKATPWMSLVAMMVAVRKWRAWRIRTRVETVTKYKCIKIHFSVLFEILRYLNQFRVHLSLEIVYFLMIYIGFLKVIQLFSWLIVSQLGQQIFTTQFIKDIYNLQYSIAIQINAQIFLRPQNYSKLQVKQMDQLYLRSQVKNYFASLTGKGKILAREIEQGDALKFFACLKAVGLLRATWVNSRKKIISYNYGTAFAVSPNIIITCLHNIYSQKLQRICDETIFIPNINVEYVKDDVRKYKVVKMEFIQYKMAVKRAFDLPLKNELVLMYLEGNIKLDFFLKIGLLSNKPQYKDTGLVIIGYPSRDLKEAKILSQAYPKREIRKGKLYSIDNNIVNYTISTEVGLSGSPVLCYNEMREYVVVGMHTHRGKESGYNSGLFFSREVLQCLYQYESNIYRYLGVEKRMQTNIMEIIIYFYLFFKNLRYRSTYTILSPETYNNKSRIENEYLNFVPDISVEGDIQYKDLISKQIGSERDLVQIERRSSGSDDVSEAYLCSCSYHDDLQESISLISILEDSQNPQQRIQHGDEQMTGKSV